MDVVRLALKSRAFVVSALVLGIGAVGLQAAASHLRIRFRKEAAPILSPLKFMDLDALAPYEVVRKQSLQPDEEQTLGTSEYISWIMKNTSVPANDPLRFVHLFVTYYTGMPDQVPHVPDICYLGGGYSPLRSGTYSFEMPELAELGYDTEVPYRALTFSKPGDVADIRPTVVYTFGVNNILEAERNRVRKTMAGIRQRYAYFSKVEVSFGLGREYPRPGDAVDAAKDMLRKVLPVLIEDHWPDLDDMNAPPEPGAARNDTAG